ncbi:hypothetical protein D3C85_1326000 [compost metagenome]
MLARFDSGRATYQLIGLALVDEHGTDHVAGHRVQVQFDEVLALHLQGLVDGQLHAFIQARRDRQRGRQVVESRGLQGGRRPHEQLRQVRLHRAVATGDTETLLVPGLHRLGGFE